MLLYKHTPIHTTVCDVCVCVLDGVTHSTPASAHSHIPDSLPLIQCIPTPAAGQVWGRLRKYCLTACVCVCVCVCISTQHCNVCVLMILTQCSLKRDGMVNSCRWTLMSIPRLCIMLRAAILSRTRMTSTGSRGTHGQGVYPHPHPPGIAMLCF